MVAAEEGEPQQKKTKVASKDQEQRRECYLVSALSGSISNRAETWLIDSGAFRHMRGFKKAITNYKDKKFDVKVELGDDGTYDIKGIGSASFQLVSGTVLHVEEILYVPGLKKNLISIAVLENKGYTVTF